ncbi:MAG: signal recognition particle protein, partial [Micromonosporaceae bacterium]|nr:signal recognition particle protein [Micromonosporaceae bacterium]
LNRFTEAQKMMKQMGPMMGMPGRRKATKSPKNKRKGTKGGGRMRTGGPIGKGMPGMPQLPPGLDPSALDPSGGFVAPKLDFNKLKKRDEK